MRLLPERYRLLTWISLLLVAGFLATSIASYVVSRDAIRQNVAEQTLPLTSDNIYSEIQKDILRPVFITSLMSNDTFVRDWILTGEHDTDRIARYLKQIKEKYGTVSTSLISAHTLNYYYAGGLLKTISATEPRDVWYYRVRDMQADYEINVDIDMANRDAMTIFINHRMFDYDGNFIGVASVGLTLDAVAHLLENYQTRFHRTVYFVDREGNIKLAGKALKDVHDPIGRLPGIADVADKVLNDSSTPIHHEFQRGDATVLMSSRFVPELNWYLLVEQNISDDVLPVQRVLYLNIAISAIVTLLILGMVQLVVRRSHRQMEAVAGTDTLTGLLNRQAFEMVFHQAMLDSERRGTPLCAILFDLDYFKNVNDAHGHLAGDRVLRDVAGIARGAVRENDIVARWGGEEFLVLLKDCPLQQAIVIAEKLRTRIATHDFALQGSDLLLTTSLGIAEYAQRESPSDFFSRADRALYQAKEKGRNRIAVSQPPSQPTSPSAPPTTRDNG
ncbi:GGDEF domain-containing protein [Oxalicibacterium flavum]|uniref:diguanylate cyclase n=1 Tax=Oxalicibacterium flavum TaxID=179467 RepID=A0A8J2UMH8_9BURK|nr:sensor domain-containing diguanylate cyclase [Oxalicibacterium flavum]GGC11975.1 GGDEF domain-containing protein [Oxalicibacterium flavum]